MRHFAIIVIIIIIIMTQPAISRIFPGRLPGGGAAQVGHDVDAGYLGHLGGILLVHQGTRRYPPYLLSCCCGGTPHVFPAHRGNPQPRVGVLLASPRRRPLLIGVKLLFVTLGDL